MITVDLMNKMIAKAGNGVAQCSPEMFCKIVNEPLPEYTDDVIDVLKKVQDFTDNRSNGKTIVFGYSSHYREVHWHVFNSNDTRAQWQAGHICWKKNGSYRT
jgi:hypothetical protein